MKAIHNIDMLTEKYSEVVLYPKDTEKWKQFTTIGRSFRHDQTLFCIPKILKNESNSQQNQTIAFIPERCFVSQRYWKMKAIHNAMDLTVEAAFVVLYPKDTEKWKQFTTNEVKVELNA